MRKSDNSDGGRKAGDTGQLWLRLPGLVGEALYETVIGVGLACVDEALEAERAALCGARYVHRADRQALRAGHLASSLVLGGRRVAVSCPRVRSVEGRELKLPSWQEWSARYLLDERALEQMVLEYRPALCALVGTVTANGPSPRRQQECGERSVRLWHRAQACGTDEPQPARTRLGRADDRRGALR